MDSLPATLDLTPLPVELLRPGGLLLIPVLVLLWWLLGRRREARSVGSTALWHQLGEGEAGPSRDGGRLLFLLLLALAASRPCLWWPPPDEGGGLPPARLVREGRGGPPSSTGLAVEGILEAGQGEREITVSARGRRVARVALALDPGRPAAWRAALPALAEGDRIRVTIRADGSPPLSLDLTAPPPPEPPSVEDRSGCRAIADALLALEQGGFIRRVTAEGDASVFRGRGAHELEGGDPSITIPARDAPVAGILPRPRPGMPPRPLLSGLDARRWTILSRREPLLDGIGVETILPSTAGSLLARRGRHVAFAFDPDDSDLPDRPAWPVLLGRILEEIVPRQAPESEPGPRRSPLPAILLIALALAVIPWAARTRRARIALALCLLAALAVPPLRFGGPPRARLEAGRDGIGAGAQAFTEAARRLADGGLVEVPPGTPPPLEESSLLAELRARRVALVPAGTEPAPPTVAAESSMVSEGAIVRLLVSPAFFPGTITRWRRPRPRAVGGSTAPASPGSGVISSRTLTGSRWRGPRSRWRAGSRSSSWRGTSPREHAPWSRVRDSRSRSARRRLPRSSPNGLTRGGGVSTRTVHPHGSRFARGSSRMPVVGRDPALVFIMRGEDGRDR
ncbi:MAG: hypothetical protein ACE5GW_12255 [Planctomycetota bacterium]